VGHAVVIEKIVAIVNDTAITLSDINSFKNKIESGGLVDDALLKMRDPKTLVKNDKAIVDHLIDERLIDSEIKRLGMNVTIEKVEQEIRSITSRNGISRDQLKSALKERGVVFSDYQDFIKTSLERQALIDREVSSKIKISDEDISNYYLANNKGSSGQVFEYRLAHILIQDNPSSGVPAKDRMLSVINRLDSGKEDFAKLASQYSEDPSFSQGGILGTFKAGEMIKEIQAGIQNLGEGQISGVIKTRLGYHVIKVLKKTLVSDPALDAQRNAIYSKLFAQTFEKQFRKWLDRKRDDAFIRTN
jgi:peptidyl-prolyl cis-trans isomerase SurA